MSWTKKHPKCYLRTSSNQMLLNHAVDGDVELVQTLSSREESLERSPRCSVQRSAGRVLAETVVSDVGGQGRP